MKNFSAFFVAAFLGTQSFAFAASLNVEAIHHLGALIGGDALELRFEGVTSAGQNCDVVIEHLADGLRLSARSEESIEFVLPASGVGNLGLKNEVTEVEGSEYELRIKILAEKRISHFKAKRQVVRGIVIGFEDDRSITSITLTDGFRSMGCVQE